MFDTGSSDVWVMDKRITLKNREKKYSYDNEASTTSKKMKMNKSVQFGSGFVAGDFYSDDVRFGSCDGGGHGMIHVKS